ncbi:excalibur domain-containing protein [Mycobacterium sp. CVI_P3]|uniref:Excalibur domain-containing protein n=1 Tax=Mycobacterium pinniadriaticum TaxID=2994102 RepID=A0ABT3SIX4_9MYCO|nr:excalibur domain-containing protein [Mycobacterium pinniadriaticum]MCX2933059.1 excalibur domain-containing protein [Mycobacterium pinniadriaticum]MCX2939481.1 excalibur domain-containing protein [Mycobacterium pinniadriaticum]
MGKLTMLAIGFALGLALSPAATADPDGGSVAQSAGPHVRAPSSNCDPNYSGACVPIASDVDCAGGSGNGPAYVSGPVTVIGRDIYGLDRDGNGVGCE